MGAQYTIQDLIEKSDAQYWEMAVLVVGRQFTIDMALTEFTWQWFEREKLLGAKVMETLFPQLAPVSESYDEVFGALDSVFSFGIFQWPNSMESFPKMTMLEVLDPYTGKLTKKNFALLYWPILKRESEGNAEEVADIAIGLTDLTRDLCKWNPTANLDLNQSIGMEILRKNPEEIEIFLKGCLASLQGHRDQLQRHLAQVDSKQLAGERVEELFQAYHALKGMARLYQLDHLSAQIFEAESVLRVVRPSVEGVSDGQRAGVLQDFDRHLGQTLELAERYAQVGRDKFKMKIDLEQNSIFREERVEIGHHRFQDFGNFLLKLANGLSEEKSSELFKRYEDLLSFTMEGLYRQLQEQALIASGRLGKSVKMELMGGKIKVPTLTFYVVKDTLSFLVEQAIEKSIASINLRAKNKKPSSATIRIEAQEKNEHLTILFKDDGDHLSCLEDELLRPLKMRLKGEGGKLIDLKAKEQEKSPGLELKLKIPIFKV